MTKAGFGYTVALLSLSCPLAVLANEVSTSTRSRSPQAVSRQSRTLTPSGQNAGRVTPRDTLDVSHSVVPVAPSQRTVTSVSPRPSPAATGDAFGGLTALLSLQEHPEQSTHTSPQWGTVLTDIARRLPMDARYQDVYRRYIASSDLVTAGHEWTHFLNEHLGLRSGAGRSAYYLLDGRYATLSDPRGLQGTVPHVPASLRGDLYNLYLVENGGNAQVDPLYLLDEWVAYANDVTVAVDQLDHGKPLNPFNLRAIQPGTAGNVLEFMFYGCAVGMAVKQYDPAYYAGPEGRKLRAFIAWNVQRSLDIHAKGVLRSELSSGDARNDALLRSFRTSADTAEMRAWVRSDLGGALAHVLAGMTPPGSGLSSAGAGDTPFAAVFPLDPSGSNAESRTAASPQRLVRR